MIALIVLILLLSLIALKQYQSKRQFEEKNRQLILQNDSIMAINIQMAKQLLQYKHEDISFSNEKRHRPHAK